jgi:ketol-acid reductoisomerase
MGEVLEEIRSGAFAREWTREQERAGAILDKVREARQKLPMAVWEERARSAFRIGAADRDA